MASLVLKKAGLSLFESHLKRYEPEDPLYVYETYTDKKGREKVRKRKRELPDGLSRRDQKLLKKVNKRARRLDRGFNICGIRFGYTFIIGLVPGVGDVANGMLSYTLVIRPAKKAEIPDWLLHRMYFNTAVQVTVGFVPLVGDVLMAVWGANSRNAALLQEFLRIRSEQFLKGQTNVAQEEPKGKGKRMPTEDLKVIKPGAGM